MRVPIASEGYIFIVPLALLAAGFAWAKLPWVAGVWFLGFLFVTNFFRDPERVIPDGDGVVVSPADGKVVAIVEETDPLLEGNYTRVSIFLDVFNVHVNRVPIAGTIDKVRYNRGKFFNAASHKASLDNEQNALLIQGEKHKIVIKQIAGLIARRIVCKAKEGDRYALGERFGLIRFGSRTDLFLPEGTRLEVAIGDKVHGGSSVIGYLP